MKQWIQTHERWILIIILLLSLSIRIGLIFTVTEPIDRDAKEYYDLALNLVAGNGFSIDGLQPTARRSPGYPFALAGIIAIFGSNPQTLYFFQALINVLTIFLVFLSLKANNIKSPLRLLTILLFSFSTSFIYINVLYAEILTMLFVALILFLSVHQSLRSRRWTQSTLLGIAIGALIYLRPTFLYLPIIILICVFILKTFRWRFPIRNYIVIAGTALVTLAPWTIRNYVVFRQFIPLVSAGGGELWGANFAIDERVVWHSVTDIQQYENERSVSHTHQKALIAQYQRQYNFATVEELNRFLSKQGLAIIRRHPFRYALLSLNRALIFWFSPPIGATTMKAISPAIFMFFLLVKYTITILGIIGLWRWAKDNFSGALTILMLVVYLTLLHTATHAIQRYFLPLIPVMYFALGYFLNSSTTFIPLETSSSQRNSRHESSNNI